MNNLFFPYLRNFILVVFHDIIFYSKNWNPHLKRVDIVLRLLEENNFYINKSKCTFRRRETKILGHVVSAKGIVETKNIEAITK
jgi:hypothetical protein